ncbi:hypothetical protein Bpfe_024020 [Biomphalaria pfeifferi]|uniref:Uncharacterized protein n=1 Tax=Biomphalaria pfeifferi TaxID=112525 RepID=A0AAD8EZR6_BIOPF|nr:hypothetical protein Bpfe_024020 [Biomphalaria pfeifferi]
MRENTKVSISVRNLQITSGTSNISQKSPSHQWNIKHQSKITKSRVVHQTSVRNLQVTSRASNISQKSPSHEWSIKHQSDISKSPVEH